MDNKRTLRYSFLYRKEREDDNVALLSGGRAMEKLVQSGGGVNRFTIGFEQADANIFVCRSDRLVRRDNNSRHVSQVGKAGDHTIHSMGTSNSLPYVPVIMDRPGPHLSFCV